MRDHGADPRANAAAPVVAPAAALLLLSLVATGCANNDPALAIMSVTTPPIGAVSLQHDVQPIFDGNCTSRGCHIAGLEPFNAGLNLETGNAYANLVGPSGTGVPSTEATGLLRVKPGRSAESYLINKLEGTAGQVVTTDPSQMPLGFPPLSPSTIQLIRDWIDQGAQDN